MHIEEVWRNKKDGRTVRIVKLFKEGNRHLVYYDVLSQDNSDFPANTQMQSEVGIFQHDFEREN